MDTSTHSMSTLFAQLGLPSGDADIDTFVARHAPLKADISLNDAPFWSAAQARFISDAWREDSDWAELVDQLDALLR